MISSNKNLGVQSFGDEIVFRRQSSSSKGRFRGRRGFKRRACYPGTNSRFFAHSRATNRDFCTERWKARTNLVEGPASSHPGSRRFSWRSVVRTESAPAVVDQIRSLAKSRPEIWVHRLAPWRHAQGMA